MARFALILLVLAGPTAYAARCRVLIQERGNPLVPRAVVELNRVASAVFTPSITVLNSKVFLLDDRSMEDDDGVTIAPGELLNLLIPSQRGKEALKAPVSVAIAPLQKKFVFFIVGENGSLQAFAPHSSDPRTYSAASIPKPQACAQREKMAAVKVFEFESEIYLYIATNRGRIFRTVLNVSDGRKPNEKWELLAQNASPQFAIIGLNDLVYLDRLGSIYLQQSGRREWLGHFPKPVTSFSALAVPRENSMYTHLDERIVVWMTALDDGQPALYRWHMLPGLRKARVVRPTLPGEHFPVAVAAIHEDKGRLQERVIVLTTRADSEPQPFQVHLQADDTWVSPQWWEEDLVRRPPARRRPSRPRRQSVASQAMAKRMEEFLKASGVTEPRALQTVYRTMTEMPWQSGVAPILKIVDLALLAHVYSSRTDEALSTLINADLYKDFADASPIPANSTDLPYDTRFDDFPNSSRKTTVLTAIFTMARQFPAYADPWRMLRYWRDLVAAIPMYAEMEFWEFLDLVYDRLATEREMNEGGS